MSTYARILAERHAPDLREYMKSRFRRNCTDYQLYIELQERNRYLNPGGPSGKLLELLAEGTNASKRLAGQHVVRTMFWSGLWRCDNPAWQYELAVRKRECSPPQLYRKCAEPYLAYVYGAGEFMGDHRMAGSAHIYVQPIRMTTILAVAAHMVYEGHDLPNAGPISSI